MKIPEFLSRFDAVKKTVKGWIVCCPSHEDNSPSLSIAEGKDGAILLTCFAGCDTESVVSRMGLKMSDLFPDTNGHQTLQDDRRRVFTPKTTPEPPPPTGKPVIDKIYSYQDALGSERYQALRMKPKSFRQRHRVNSDWVWSMDGVERVLYRLPQVLASQQVWIVEGEKDADNLSAIGCCATCNVGGAGKWLDGYTETVAGKDVVLCGDNDKPGQEHVQKVFGSIAGRAKSVRIIKIPMPHKDVSDYLEATPDKEAALRFLSELVAAAVPFVDGVKLPLYSMTEIEPMYERQAKVVTSIRLNIEAMLPNIGRATRPMIPGDMMLVIGDTGTGKTAILVNLWKNNNALRTIFFQQELPLESMFERFVSNTCGGTGREVEIEYQDGRPVGEKALSKIFANLLICPEPGLTLTRIEQMILKSELKFGAKAQLVFIDYAQLAVGEGKNRTESMANFAEGIKRLAKSTNTIIVLASQVTRPKEGEKPNQIGLHSAKDSGSLENSCGLALGAWRDAKDVTLLTIKALKATKGGGGSVDLCEFDGARMKITPR
jgi:hypothetical protein